MNFSIKTKVLIVGSGAGGAVSALELAQGGYEVLVLEEGKRHELSDYGADSVTAMKLLYRNRGMTPIMGSSPIGFIEGCCLGGSTEINSGLWLRMPSETLLHWRKEYGLKDFTCEDMESHFEWAEQELSVSKRTRPLPLNSLIFQQGAQALGWHAEEVPRAANGCVDTNRCTSGCPKGAKQGMSFNLIPRAEAAGARFITDCKVLSLFRTGDMVTGVHAQINRGNGVTETLNIQAEHIFLCAGATQTPLILRRSGIKTDVGNSLKIHLMLKVAALFDEEVNAQQNVLPVIMVSEFQPDYLLGGCYFTSGHLAALLSENWDHTQKLMRHYRKMATYSVIACGTGYGTVRYAFPEKAKTIMHYELTLLDLRRLGHGLARLSRLLLAAGAREIYPCINGLPKISSVQEANRWLDEPLPRSGLGLTTVHAFSTCPMGEQGKYPADSFGKLRGLKNLYVNDASMLPDSPGVNPQATIMAVSRRNVRKFIERNCR